MSQVRRDVRVEGPVTSGFGFNPGAIVTGGFGLFGTEFVSAYTSHSNKDRLTPRQRLQEQIIQEDNEIIEIIAMMERIL